MKGITTKFYLPAALIIGAGGGILMAHHLSAQAQATFAATTHSQTQPGSSSCHLGMCNEMTLAHDPSQDSQSAQN